LFMPEARNLYAFIIKTLNELKTAGLLIKDAEGYKISSSLIQKGGGRK